MLKPQPQLQFARDTTRCRAFPLIAGAREGFVEVRVECARRGLFLVSAAGELRDGIPGRLRERILPAGFHVRCVARMRARDVGVDVPGPASASEYQRLVGRWFVEVTHAPI